ILIKPLALAERDGDHIYGVIKGIEINHGGRAMGYTAPNPGAQRRLIERVLKKADVSARRIGYVEAHGTGTALGDPIEVEALSAAYSSESDETQFCQLGSVKSHVGHLEAAAGICAITKVLMQLKHRQIAPGLHAEALNAGIAFQQTPFEVTRTLREWPSPPGEARVCAVSSFGAGGANGHLIVEEYVTSHPRDVVPGRVAVVLSAQGNTQLQTQARNLLRMIETQPPETYDLASLAYTLQVGREAMSVRLALLADSPQRLAAGLKRFLKNPDDTGDDIFFGQVKDAEPQFYDDAALTQAMKTSDYASLLAQWVRGVNVAWEKGYQQNVPQRMSLPTYPFLRESYWLPGADMAPSVAQCPQEDKASVSDDPVLGLLQRLAEGQLPPAEAARAFTLCTSAHTRRSLVFMFAGVGDCYPNMGRGLYETQEVFRREMDLCFMLLKEGYNLDLKDLLYPGEPPVI
ncbi:MAG: ketoacyl-synthetase C-terminal extension domain-containing protein, partial [Enterobacter roggenkampii]